MKSAAIGITISTLLVFGGRYIINSLSDDVAQKVVEKSDDVVVEVFSESGSKTNLAFATEDKLIPHFEKHGDEFKEIFNSADEYLQGAQAVMKNGYKVEYIYKDETRIGYVQFM